MEREANVNKFTLPGTEDKDKTLSSQVLEYYQKYSLNPELPKYFSGTPTTFKPENWSEFSVRGVDNWFDPSNIKPGDITESVTVAVNTEEIEEERIEPCIASQDNLCELEQSANIDNVRTVSPASSVTSNRKLEWDNGADIGYSNVSTHKILQKSISLPVLTDVEYEKLQTNLLKLDQKSQIKQFRSEHSSTSDLISNSPFCSCKKQSLLISFNPAYSSTTSESVKSLKRTYIRSSTSSESIQQEQQFSNNSDSSDSSSETQESGSILNFLRGRFGLPIAESTRLIRIEQLNEVGDSDAVAYCETPKLPSPKQEEIFENLATNTIVLGEKLSNSCEDLNSPTLNNPAKRWSSQIDLSMVDRVSHYKNMKILKLCTSKPVVVECCGNSEPPTGENKFIQTSLPRNASIAVQTDFDFSSARFKRVSPKHQDRQSVVYICHSDSGKDENTHSSSTQTNSNVLSNCNSFEYLYGADYDQNFQKVSEEVKTNAKYEADAVRKLLMSNLKRCPPKSDLATTTPDSEKTRSTSSNLESTSKETPLTDSRSSTKNGLQKHSSKPGSVAGVRSSTQSTSKDSLSVELRSPAQSTPKESPLTELLSSKQSGRLITDLENKLILLQKLVKSTKYNSATKKYYLRKIVTKIVDSKYVDDSSGSNDTTQNLKNAKTKNTDKTNYHPTSGSNAGSSKSNHKFKDARLQDNIPWKPVQHTFHNQNVVNMSPKRRVVPRKLQTETFINEILPTKPQELKVTGTNFVPIQVIRDGSNRLQRNPLFTLPNNDVLVPEDVKKIGDHARESSNSTANELYEELQPAVSQIATPIVSSSSDLKKTSSDGGKSNGLRSWREDMTRSEQLLEKKFHKDKDFTNKDQLASFAKKEREHQLYWINNEITHLNKLKKLLEKKQSPMNKDAEQKVLSTIVQKPFVEDMKGIQKSTTVYVLTTEKHCNRRTCKNPNCHACSSRRGLRSGSCKCDGSCCRCKENAGTYEYLKDVAPTSRNHKQNVLEIGSEKVDLKRARLVSNEQYTTNNSDQPRKTSIRRYTFEIPLEEDTTTDDYECVPQCAAACSRGMEKCPVRSRGRSTSPTTSSRTSPKTSPRASPRVSPRASPSRSPKLISRASSKASSKASRLSPKESPKVSPKTSPTVTGNVKTRRLTQELVITDEITDSKPKSQPAVSCTSANDCSCSSSTTSSSDSDASSTTTQVLCECCKREPASAKPSKHESKEPKEKYILCHPCYNRNVDYCGERGSYLYPGHICKCYSAMQAETVQRIHETIKELDDLEKEEEVCKCSSRKQAVSGYCARCKCKLNEECFSKKGGLAYDLTLESDDEKKKHRKHKKKKHFPEVRIQLESPRKSKCHHKKDNKQKCRCCECNNSEKEEEASDDAVTVKSKHKKHKSKRRSTIQDYLYANKPNFVAAADERRQCMIDLAYLRGKRSQKYQQLLALANHLPGPTNATKKRPISIVEKPHIFDPKEMVQNTAKNYKKLPEVQQKMKDNRERGIRQANRLLADIFNRKLRDHVLKGRLTLPPDANIIDLY